MSVLRMTCGWICAVTGGGQDTLMNRVKSSYFGLAFDGSPDKTGIGKLRYWRDEVELEFK